MVQEWKARRTQKTSLRVKTNQMTSLVYVKGLRREGQVTSGHSMVPYHIASVTGKALTNPGIERAALGKVCCNCKKHLNR